MRMLVLGAGLQGSACAYDLLQHADVERVTIADRRTDRLPKFLTAARGKRLKVAKLDAKKPGALQRLMRGHDAVMCALPYYFNERVAKAAVSLGLNHADLGGNTEIVQQQKKLHAKALKKGLSVIPDCGLAPGMINIIAAEGIRRVGDALSVKIYVGGLPQHPEPPLNYQIVYSLEGALDYYTTPSWALRGEVTGKSGKKVAWQLLDYYDAERGISAMMRTTGYSLAITGLMQVDGRITARGAHTPDEAVPFGPYVNELKKRGIEIREV